ncbi:aldo/keto reductase [bacterium]|nr:aldo/keto reductase [bacterium]
MSAPENRIGRKEFLSGCGRAVLGLGLGAAACSPASGGKASGGAAAPAADSVAAKITPSYRSLGKAGIQVTEVGFGASRTMDPQLMAFAMDRGINVLDTGRSYNNGQNEVVVGKVIKGRRDKVVIISKTQPGTLEKMRSDMETSLTALGTDYIDCLLVHGIGETAEITNEVHKEFLTRAKEEGKARVTGFSCHGDLPAMLNTAAADRFYEVVMTPYNFMGAFTHMLGGNHMSWDAQAMGKAVENCGQAGIDIIAIKTCSGGFRQDNTGPQTYAAALKWVLQSPCVKTTATAMGNFQQIEADAAAMGAGGLGLEEWELLEQYAARFGRNFCRMCGACRGQCPNGVNVPEVNRFQMYATGYCGTMDDQARSGYARLGGCDATACTDCSGCTVRCAYGLPLGSKLKAAHALLA